MTASSVWDRNPYERSYSGYTSPSPQNTTGANGNNSDLLIVFFVLFFIFMGVYLLNERWGSVLESGDSKKKRIASLALKLATYIAYSLILLLGALSIDILKNDGLSFALRRFPLADYSFSLLVPLSFLVFMRGVSAGRRVALFLTSVFALVVVDSILKNITLDFYLAKKISLQAATVLTGLAGTASFLVSCCVAWCGMRKFKVVPPPKETQDVPETPEPSKIVLRNERNRSRWKKNRLVELAEQARPKKAGRGSSSL